SMILLAFFAFLNSAGTTKVPASKTSIFVLGAADDFASVASTAAAGGPALTHEGNATVLSATLPIQSAGSMDAGRDRVNVIFFTSVVGHLAWDIYGRVELAVTHNSITLPPK